MQGLGKIIGIEDNTIILKLHIKLEEFPNIINLYVIIEDSKTKFVGEVIDIKDGIAYISLCGEYINGKFSFGVSKMPSFKSIVKLISKEKVANIIGMSNYGEKKELYIGESPI